MKPAHAPETPATLFLRQQGAPYSSHLDAYEGHGGKRGFLVGIDPKDLVRVLQPQPVSVALAG